MGKKGDWRNVNFTFGGGGRDSRRTQRGQDQRGPQRQGGPPRAGRANQQEEPPGIPYPLPKETRELLARPQVRTQNFGLAMQRYIRYESNWLMRQEQQKEVLTGLVTPSDDPAKQSTQAVLGGCHKRLELLLDSYKALGWCTGGPCQYGVQWRMVVGLGSASVLEGSGMTLHPIYGFPYIPGSSVKGLCQSVALREIWENRGEKAFEELGINGLDGKLGVGDLKNLNEMIDKSGLSRGQKDELKKDLERFHRIFGSQNQKGSFVFLDAIPDSFPKMEVDIVNVHYGDYYQEGKAPADYLSPSPVYFLTVARGTTFHFYLAARKLGDGASADDDMKTVLGWLKTGLEDYGIGGKKAAGYGELMIEHESSD